MKFAVDGVVPHKDWSPPARGRGLKFESAARRQRCGDVAPCAGAWIEMGADGGAAQASPLARGRGAKSFCLRHRHEGSSGTKDGSEGCGMDCRSAAVWTTEKQLHSQQSAARTSRAGHISAESGGREKPQIESAPPGARHWGKGSAEGETPLAGALGILRLHGPQTWPPTARRGELGGGPTK